jgi:AraC-like DNA-binding protein
MAQSEGFTPTGEFLIEECTMKAPLATMHYHNSYELYYVVKGERDYFIENQFFKASNNNVVLVPKGLPHRTAGKGATRILVNFTDEFLLRYFSKKVIDNILSDFKPIVLTPSKEENDRLQALLKKMISEYDRIGKKAPIEKFDDSVLPIFLFELLYLLKFGNFIPLVQEINDKRINDIIKYINTNYAAIESIDNVADYFFISKYHLCRTWKKNLGISLVSYLNMIKIKAACSFIDEGNEKITDIAMKCGFNSSAYFCKVFKEETGLSPREYKKHIKKKT